MFPNRMVFSDKLIELLSEEFFTGYLLTVWDSLFLKSGILKAPYRFWEI